MTRNRALAAKREGIWVIKVRFPVEAGVPLERPLQGRELQCADGCVHAIPPVSTQGADMSLSALKGVRTVEPWAA